MRGFRSRFSAVLGVAFCIGLMAADTADAARRGGGFGSRGARTYQAPPPTKTAPQPAAPIQRSMTQPAPGQAAPKAATPAAAPAAARAAQPPRRGGMMGGLLGGLLLGGLIGAMLGNGFGAGMMGFMSVLLQLAVVAGIVFLLVKLFRRRSHQPAMAGAASWANPTAARAPYPPQPQDFGATASPRAGYAPASAAPAAATPVEILITPKDRDAFERLLMEVQDALGREDYGALRERTTPEVMGFLAEDMAQHATEGRRNEISGTKLLEADVAEAWREDDREYATAAMRYEALDVTRDRTTGAVLEGDPDRPTQTTELWTFVRHQGGPWKLSAIQEA
jgi:predicted lipid-binding transport protein (Tim44 family)